MDLKSVEPAAMLFQIMNTDQLTKDMSVFISEGFVFS